MRQGRGHVVVVVGKDGTDNQRKQQPQREGPRGDAGRLLRKPREGGRADVGGCRPKLAVFQYLCHCFISLRPWPTRSVNDRAVWPAPNRPSDGASGGRLARSAPQPGRSPSSGAAANYLGGGYLA